MNPGIVVDRRHFIFAGAAAATAVGEAMANDGAFRGFMDALESLGDQLPLVEAAEQNAYIYRLAAQAMLMRDFPTVAMGPMGRTGVEIGPLGRTEPPTDSVHGIALVSYRMAPGAWLQPHNHPNYSVATVGLEGEAIVSHFEPEDAPPMDSREPFNVRRTAERVLRRGEASTLSPRRDNIHTFRAGPGGARFVDLFSVHGQDVGFSFLEIGQNPTMAGGDRFRARWIGNQPGNL